MAVEMDMNKIFSLIVDRDLPKFKEQIMKSTINSHHKELILNFCYKSKDYDFIEFMSQHSGNNEKDLIAFLEDIMDEEVDKKMLKFFNTLNDDNVIEKIDRKFFQKLISVQDDETFIWFIQKFPLTAIKNFNKIAYFSLLNDKLENIDIFKDFSFDYKTCYSICLYGYEFDKTDMVHDFLVSQIKRDFKGIEELKKHHKSLYARHQLEVTYLRNWMQGIIGKSLPKNVVQKSDKKADIDAFMDEQITMAFKAYLNKKVPTSKAEKKMNKI